MTPNPKNFEVRFMVCRKVKDLIKSASDCLGLSETSFLRGTAVAQSVKVIANARDRKSNTKYYLQVDQNIETLIEEKKENKN